MLVPTERFSPSQAWPSPRKIAVLGSTGSIGKSALDVIRTHPEKFNILGLSAYGDVQELASQVAEFHPSFVALGDSTKQGLLLEELAKRNISGRSSPTLLFGESAVSELASMSDVHTVLLGVSGCAGLRPMLSAAKAGKVVALANKECLVMGGALIKELMAQSGSKIIPVDSEHSGVFQILQGHNSGDLESITLTASGGPFFRTPIEELRFVKPEHALKHPTWQMGEKITIDSATMVNKGLELIEAHWLFNFEPHMIRVTIHPQSVVHAFINFQDGTSICQLAKADMRGPIAYALGYPDGRLKNIVKPFDFNVESTLEFYPLDNEKFPAVNLARSCIDHGAGACAVFSVANEGAVKAFLERKIGFLDIINIIRHALEYFSSHTVSSISALFELEIAVRVKTEELINLARK